MCRSNGSRRFSGSKSFTRQPSRSIVFWSPSLAVPFSTFNSSAATFRLSGRALAHGWKSPEIPVSFKDPDGYWTGFAARARVFIVHKNAGAKPDSVLAYAAPQWRAKTVIANPLFGTITAEIAALFVLWGDEPAQAFMAALKANAVKLSPSNGDSADLVANGEFAFSLVDSDDVVSRMRQHLPIELVLSGSGRRQGLSACGSATSAPSVPFKPRTFCDVGSDRLNLNANPSAADKPLVLKLSNHGLCCLSGKVEGNANRPA